ncbi:MULTISPECIES: hypothetical protein [Pontibacillus]|uniref:Fur-regulated basic protein FbpA n=1 Tax=Pontibacillus chungwhensis TaxID=265426 RepID=A0ABY8V289_9BACI|nr:MULTISPECIES: hypothetical protein [Pontibacillus]MCD5324751.1 hypothetical protein [Pontibacillus sp. HN14]WIF98710.1 hypothetical protein QNI29_03400 [Pontibacillus chungwhensis]
MTNGEENQLRKAVNASRRRQFLIGVLLDMDVETSAAGKSIKDLSLYELEDLHASKKYRFANSGVNS